METRVERLAGDDQKITQADIQRLQALDPEGDLRIAREILPPDFFAQLEAGKWFWISSGSVLGRSGYIERLNQIGIKYEQEREAVEEESSQALGTISPSIWSQETPIENGQTIFTRTLRLSSPLMRGPDVQLLQQKLTQAGFDTQGVDGVFGRNTQRALISYQQQILGQRGDGVMDLGGQTMQSFWQDQAVASPQTTPREETPTQRSVPEVRERSQRPDIQQALQENGIMDPVVIERVEGALVSISGGVFGTRGSGSFIAPNMILTAEHVIRDLDTGEYKDITLRDGLGNRYDIVRMYVDPSNNDIAFIETRQRSQNYLPLASGNTERRIDQEWVLLWFHENRPRFQRAAQTERMRQTEAWIHPRFDRSWQDFAYFDALPGDSGGPIILRDGTIGGVAIARYDEEYGQGTVYETASYIRNLYTSFT